MRRGQERESFALLQTLPPASFANLSVLASSALTIPSHFSACLLLHVHGSSAAEKRISPVHAFPYKEQY